MESMIFCLLFGIFLMFIPIYLVLSRIAKCLETFFYSISKISVKIDENSLWSKHCTFTKIEIINWNKYFSIIFDDYLFLLIDLTL